MGVVPLRMCRVSENTKAGKTFCFDLTAPKISKTFLIQANSKGEVRCTSYCRYAYCEKVDEWMKAIEKASEYSCVSTPYNVEHKIHVDFNSASGE